MEATELQYPAEKMTGVTTAAVTGGRFLAIQDNVATSGANTGLLPVAHAGNKGQAHFLARFDAASGAIASMVSAGRWIMTAGAAITAPAKIMSDANGKAITATDDAYVLGYATSDAAADGDPVEVLLMLPGFFINAA